MRRGAIYYPLPAMLEVSSEIYWLHVYWFHASLNAGVEGQDWAYFYHPRRND